MQFHMLKHGGIPANGHCVTFPQNVNEPAQILPNLPLGYDYKFSQLMTVSFIIIRLGLNVGLTHQNRSYRDSEAKGNVEA